MTNDKTDFRPMCPLCGATDHEMYTYGDDRIPVYACPKAPENSVMGYCYSLTHPPDKGYCGLAPLETGEQDPYWRDGVCKQHDERFIKRNKSTWVVTRDFVTGATKTMLRGAWAVVGYPFYVLVGGIGGAIRYKFGGKK